jgi:hypothetical protein
VSFEDLVDLLTGGTFLSEDQSAPASFTVQDNQFVFTYNHDGGTRRYWVDASTLLIARIQHLDIRRKPIFEQRFGNFRSVEGISLPYNLRMLQLQERRAFSMAFSSLTVNTDEIQFSLDVPENAERVRWE